MPITIAYTIHARSQRHFNDPRRVWGRAARTMYVPQVRTVPTGLMMRVPIGNGQFRVQPQMMQTVVMVPQDFFVDAWICQGGDEEWDDSAISSYNGVSYFPRNTSLASVQAFVTPYMRNFLTPGRAGGTTDIDAGNYSIHVAWMPDSPAADNTGFSISQMYPF